MARVRFAVGIKRLIPFVGYHHVLMMFIAGGWIAAAFLLAGCTATIGAMSDIYMFSVSYPSQPELYNASSSESGQNTTVDGLVVRIGYFGLCVKRAVQEEWNCGKSELGLRVVLDKHGMDPLDAVGIAKHFKDNVVFPGLIIGGLALSAVAFLGLSTFPGWREEYDAKTDEDIEIKPFPSRPVSRLCLFVLTLSAFFLLVSALWQHVAAAAASSMVHFVSRGQLQGSVGPTATALVWTSFVLTVVPVFGLIVMIISINILDRLTDD